MNVTTCQLASPEQIFELVQDTMSAAIHSDELEQRISERLPAFLPIHLLFTDPQLQPIENSYAVSAITKDISVGGLGLISPVDAKGPIAIVSFESKPDLNPLMLEVRYSEQTGPFFQIGGKFNADWSNVDW